MLHINDKTLRGYEKGRVIPKQDRRELIARLYRINEDEIDWIWRG